MVFLMLKNLQNTSRRVVVCLVCISPLPHPPSPTHTLPAYQILEDVDVQDPQPDGAHNPEPVKLPCVVLAEPRLAPENR